MHVVSKTLAKPPTDALGGMVFKLLEKAVDKAVEQASTKPPTEPQPDPAPKPISNESGNPQSQDEAEAVPAAGQSQGQAPKPSSVAPAEPSAGDAPAQAPADAPAPVVAPAPADAPAPVVAPAPADAPAPVVASAPADAPLQAPAGNPPVSGIGSAAGGTGDSPWVSQQLRPGHRVVNDPNAVADIVEAELEAVNDVTTGANSSETKAKISAICSRMGAAPIAREDYHYVMSWIDFKNLKDPPYKLRAVDEVYKRELADSLLGGFHTYLSLMHTTVRRHNNHDKKPDEFFTGEGDTLRVNAYAEVLEGGHRKAGMAYNLERRRCPEDRYANCRTWNWMRKDGRDMTDFEMVNLSQHLATGAATRVYKFTDYIHRTFSLARLHLSTAADIAEQQGLQDSVCTLTEFCGVLNGSGCMGDLSASHIAVYARIGLYMAQHQEAYKTFAKYLKDDSRICLTHLSPATIYEMEPPGMLLALQCVRMLISSDATKKAGSAARKIKGGRRVPTRGPFKQFGSAFYEQVATLYNVLRSTVDATATHATVEDVLDYGVVNVGTTTRSVRDFICNQMAAFSTTNVEKRTAMIRRRVVMAMDKYLLVAPGQNAGGPGGVDSDADIVVVPDGDRDNIPSGGPAPSAGPARGGDSAVVGRGSSAAVPDVMPNVVDNGTLRRSARRAATAKGRKLNHNDFDEGRSVLSVKKTIHKKKKPTNKSSTKKPKKNVSKETTVKAVAPDSSTSEEYTDDSNQVEEGSAGEGPAGDDLPGEEQHRNRGRAFVDDVPETVPAWIRAPPSSTEPPFASWTRLVRIPTDSWQAPMSFPCVRTLLHACGLPREHRANIVLSRREVDNINLFLDLHASRTVHHAEETWLAGEHVIPNDVLQRVQACTQSTQKACAMALHNNNNALAFFMTREKELFDNGFTVLTGVMHDAHLRDRSGAIIAPSTVAPIARLVSMGNATLDKELRREDFTPGEKDAMWDHIYNRGNHAADLKDRERLASRFMSRCFLMSHYLDQQRDRDLLRAKCLVDARLGMIAAKMGIAFGAGVTRTVPSIAMPKTGGRLLATGPECIRQHLHTDCMVRTCFEGGRPRPSPVPGYFMVATGSFTAGLWVVPRSHAALALPTVPIREEALKNSKVEFITIPPYSVLIGRGDVAHGGAGFRDLGIRDGRCMRYHMPFTTHGRTLSDAVYPADIEDPIWMEPNGGNESDGGNRHSSPVPEHARQPQARSEADTEQGDSDMDMVDVDDNDGGDDKDGDEEEGDDGGGAPGGHGKCNKDDKDKDDNDDGGADGGQDGQRSSVVENDNGGTAKERTGEEGVGKKATQAVQGREVRKQASTQQRNKTVAGPVRTGQREKPVAQRGGKEPVRGVQRQKVVRRKVTLESDSDSSDSESGSDAVSYMGSGSESGGISS